MSSQIPSSKLSLSPPKNTSRLSPERNNENMARHADLKTDIEKLKDKLSPRKLSSAPSRKQGLSMDLDKPAARVSPIKSLGTPKRARSISPAKNVKRAAIIPNSELRVYGNRVPRIHSNVPKYAGSSKLVQASSIFGSPISAQSTGKIVVGGRQLRGSNSLLEKFKELPKKDEYDREDAIVSENVGEKWEGPELEVQDAKTQDQPQYLKDSPSTLLLKEVPKLKSCLKTRLAPPLVNPNIAGISFLEQERRKSVKFEDETTDEENIDVSEVFNRLASLEELIQNASKEAQTLRVLLMQLAPFRKEAD